MTDRAARIGLAILAIAALVLAATGSRDSVDTAFVGAAIAFGLAAGFYDRVLEVSTSGVKLAERRQLRAAVQRMTPDATPEQKDELVEGGAEVLASARAAGEPITPSVAVQEAHQWLQTQAQMVKAGRERVARFSKWLVSHGWDVSPLASPPYDEPDLLASRDSERAAVMVIQSPIWILASAIDRMAANASSHSAGPVTPVLVQVGPLIGEAKDRAERVGMSVYRDTANEFQHAMGPDLSERREAA